MKTKKIKKLTKTRISNKKRQKKIKKQSPTPKRGEYHTETNQ